MNTPKTNIDIHLTKQNTKLLQKKSLKKKDENFSTIQTVKNYSTSLEVSVEKCPICQEDAIYICPCANSDKKCNNNHVWYINREGKTVEGNPHK